jgi:hypothetical protein
VKTYQPDAVLLVAEPEGLAVRYGGCTAGCGACCEYVIVPIDQRIDLQPPDRLADFKHWLTLHGLSLHRSEATGELMLRIPTPCSRLEVDAEGDKFCGVYGTEDRPKLCADLPRYVESLHELKDICTYQWRVIQPGENASRVQQEMIIQQEKAEVEQKIIRQ